MFCGPLLLGDGCAAQLLLFCHCCRRSSGNICSRWSFVSRVAAIAVSPTLFDEVTV